MSDKSLEVVQNLYNGKLDAMQTAFAEAMSEKVGEAIADRRLEVASTLFLGQNKTEE